jgi:putative salt-induced outer membrane protein YdiY
MIRLGGLALLCSAIWADTLVMKNGDKLTGTYVTTTDKGVVFKSDLAGEVTVALENITEVQTNELVTLTTKDGKVLTGKLETAGANVAIAPLTGEPARIALDEVAAVRSLEGQARYEEEERRKINPEFLDLYNGSYDFGVAFARGNAITDSFNNTARLNRVTDRDKFGIYFTQINSSATFRDASGLASSETTANAIRGGWAASRNLGGTKSRGFFQGFNDYEYDAFLGLDLRTVLGGGMGYNLVRNDRGFLTLSGGGAWNREKFDSRIASDPNPRSSAEVYVQQEWVYKIGRIWSVNEKFVVFPNLTKLGDLRMNLDATLAASLTRIFGFQVTVSDRYLTNPPDGRRRNDIIFTAGIRANVPTRQK